MLEAKPFFPFVCFVSLRRAQCMLLCLKSAVSLIAVEPQKRENPGAAFTLGSPSNDGRGGTRTHDLTDVNRVVMG